MANGSSSEIRLPRGILHDHVPIRDLAPGPPPIGRLEDHIEAPDREADLIADEVHSVEVGDRPRGEDAPGGPAVGRPQDEALLARGPPQAGIHEEEAEDRPLRGINGEGRRGPRPAPVGGAVEATVAVQDPPNVGGEEAEAGLQRQHAGVP